MFNRLKASVPALVVALLMGVTFWAGCKSPTGTAGDGGRKGAGKAAMEAKQAAMKADMEKFAPSGKMGGKRPAAPSGE